MRLTTKREFNHDGTVSVSIIGTFDTNEFIIDEMPDNCFGCPVGYRFNHDDDDGEHIDCGVKTPLGNCRPETCMLKTFRAWLQEHRYSAENPELTIQDLKNLHDANDASIWVRYGVSTFPAVIDYYDGKLVVIWNALGHEDGLWEETYGTTWIAYKYRPEE